MAQGTVFKGNVAMSNTGGGFAVNDDSAVVKGNLAKGNLGGGFGLMGSSSTVTKNLAIDNLGPGFVVSLTAATAPTLSKNAAIGNTNAGLFIYSLGTAPVAMTVEKNTFFGNGVRPAFPPANCGLAIQNLGAETLTVNADGNYWGAESGPGGNPADAVGGSCTAGAVILDLTEWADKEIKVKPPAMK